MAFVLSLHFRYSKPIFLFALCNPAARFAYLFGQDHAKFPENSFGLSTLRRSANAENTLSEWIFFRRIVVRFYINSIMIIVIRMDWMNRISVQSMSSFLTDEKNDKTTMNANFIYRSHWTRSTLWQTLEQIMSCGEYPIKFKFGLEFAIKFDVYVHREFVCFGFWIELRHSLSLFVLRFCLIITLWLRLIEQRHSVSNTRPKHSLLSVWLTCRSHFH